MNGRFSGWIIFISEIEIRELFDDRQEQKGEEPRSFIAGPAKVMCGLRGNRTRKQSRKEAPIENVRWLLGRIPLQTGRPFSIPSQSSIATRPFPLSSSPLARMGVDRFDFLSGKFFRLLDIPSRTVETDGLQYTEYTSGNLS